jgi:hypothetical protein
MGLFRFWVAAHSTASACADRRAAGSRGACPHMPNRVADTQERNWMTEAFNTFLLVFAAIFPVVNPPGSALVFLGLTRGATPEIRRILAWRIARNSFCILICSLLLGALILKFYGISIPVLRVAGGFSRMEASQAKAATRSWKPPRMASRGPSCSIRPSIR